MCTRCDIGILSRSVYTSELASVVYMQVKN